MDFQPPPPPPPSYLRPPPPPPPPSLAEPHQRLPPPPPPPQHQHWYSTNQFHYANHSPSPPPPLPPQQQQQWAPHPYPSPHPPYHAHNYPPPPPYPQVNQDWAHTNVSHHQNWEYQAHNHEEDWAAKARAWAAAKAANDNQQSQLQVTHAGPEEQNHYQDHFAQPIESHYTDMQKSSLPPSSYQHHPVPGAPQHQASVGHSQQFASFSSGQTSYGNVAGDSAASFPQQENSSINHSVHPQEVPSSYSSIAGKEDAGETGKYYMSSSLPVGLGPQHAQPPLPLAARSLSMEEPGYIFPGHPTEPATNLSDQPLNFAPRFNSYESHVQSTYPVSGGPVRGLDSISSGHSNYNWAPPAGSGVVYPPVLSPASQVNPPRAISPPIPVHSAPIFGRLPAPGFQATTSSSDAPFSAGAGAALQPAGAFSYDTFGISSVSERPKKASVPNWLREEIIKNKAVITSSAPEFPSDDNHSVDETIDRSYGKGEQADSKSIDSSRSTEEYDNDEDDVETARTATINQEIKRVLTEVLLKVTDNLFDEIATEVLNEGDLTAEDDDSPAAPNNEVPTSTRAAPVVKAEAKVLVPATVMEDDSDDANEKSTSSSRGDVLGLASYASDEDEDDKIKSSAKPNSQEKANHLEFTSGSNLVENGVPLNETDAHRDKPASLSNVVNHSSVVTQSNNARLTGELVQSGDQPSSRVKSVNEEKEVLEKLVTSISKEPAGEKVVKTERPGESKLLGMDHSEDGETSRNSDRIGRHEIGRTVDHDYVKEESRKDKYEKGDKIHRGREGKHERKERTDHQNGSKDKAREKGLRSGDKVKDSNSRKRASPSDVKKSKQDTEKERKSDKEDNVRKKEKKDESDVKKSKQDTEKERKSDKEDNVRKKEKKDDKKERKDEKKEKSRHKIANDSSRHKRRRRSLSVDSRGRDTKDTNDEDHESSDDSRRKRHSRRHESPSPVRSKRRQVSRSPHSKHSQRRHSPYSSLDTARGKRSRSRSRSPVRRKR